MKKVRSVDIGGNGCRRVDVDLDSRAYLVEPVSIGPVQKTEELFDFVNNDKPDDLRGIAYGVAGVIERHDYIRKASNIPPLDGIALASETTKHYGLPSVVLNDMEAAVTGMAALLPDEPYFLGGTWSSGFGAQIAIDGKVRWLAEMGHLSLLPIASTMVAICGCKKLNHVEAFIGGDRIKEKVLAAFKEKAELAAQYQNKHPCRILDEAYMDNEEWAVKIYEDVAAIMGLFLANLQTVLHVPLIVWKGTVAENALWFLGPLIRSVMMKHLIDPSWASEDNLRFRLTPGPDNKDSLIGAAVGLASFCDL